MSRIDEKGYVMLQKKKLFLFDIDGTLALGNQLIDGARELLDYLKQTGKSVFYITNNSTRRQQDYVDYFAQWNIAVPEEAFVTAGIITAEYFQKNFADKKIFLMATPEFTAELVSRGLYIVERYEAGIDCVLVCLDRTLTYQKLADACRILQDKNVLFYATNPDLNCPVDFGAIPDCGSICTMIEQATGRTPKYIGKPEPDIVEACRRISGHSREETIVIGDRINTDLACATNAGVDGVLVLSGAVTKEEAVASGIPYVFEDVQQILDSLLENKKFCYFSE